MIVSRREYGTDVECTQEWQSPSFQTPLSESEGKRMEKKLHQSFRFNNKTAGPFHSWSTMSAGSSRNARSGHLIPPQALASNTLPATPSLGAAAASYSPRPIRSFLRTTTNKRLRLRGSSADISGHIFSSTTESNMGTSSKTATPSKTMRSSTDIVCVTSPPTPTERVLLGKAGSSHQSAISVSSDSSRESSLHP